MGSFECQLVTLWSRQVQPCMTPLLAWAVGDGAPRRPLLEEQLKDSAPRAGRTHACHSHRLPAPPAWIASSRCASGCKRLSWKRLHWSLQQSRALQEGASIQVGRSKACTRSKDPGAAAAVLVGEDSQRVGLKHPGGGWRTGAGDQSPERGLRQAGRPGPCSFTAHCASCTESHWETWPLPLAPLWLVRNPALTCQSGPQGAPSQGLEPVLDTDWKEHMATQDREDTGHCETCTSFRETSRPLFYGSFRERREHCPETGLEVEAEGVPVCPPPHAPQTPRQGSW